MSNKLSLQDITAVLADVASAVVGQFDMEALLNQSIDSAMKTLGAEVCSIFLEDKENEPNVLKCVAGSGFAKRIVGEAKYCIGEGFTGSIAKSGKEFNIKTRRELEDLIIDGQKVWKGKFDSLQWPSQESEFRNCIALPLRIKDQILGVIKVENKKVGEHFTDEDMTIFRTIANVIALTIENARLHRKAEEQSKKIPDSLSQVADAVVGHFNMRELLDQIIKTALETLNAEICSIFLEDKEIKPGLLKCVAGIGFDEDLVDLAEYSIGEGFTGEVAKSGNDYNIRSIEDIADFAKKGIWKKKYDHLQYAKGGGEFKNMLAVPLRIKDRILGVIKVENKIGENCFTDEELTVLKTIANVIALTIENSRLHKKNEEQFLKVEKQFKTISAALADVAKEIVGQFNMESLLDKVINITMKTLHASVCSIFLRDRENEPDVLKCVAGSGFAKKIVHEAKYKIGEGFTGSIVESGQEFNIKTRNELENLLIEGKKVWKGKFDQTQWPSGRSEFRNGIGLPLKIKDETFGVIKVENKLEKYGDHFTNDDFRTFKTIADVIALAIENARLHDKIETQLKAISAKAAHRINNQATNYDGIELELEEELEDPTCNRGKISSIHERLVKTTKNLKKMIGEFRNYGKPIILEKKMCSINQIVRDEAWHAKPHDWIKIELNLDGSIPNISIDEGRFAESIKELISNSIKALKKQAKSNGTILITTELRDKFDKKELYFSIADSGDGFPSHFPVFEPFISTDPQGTGLGLATVKELIEKHGGIISSDKSKLGGALIEFTMPVVF